MFCRRARRDRLVLARVSFLFAVLFAAVPCVVVALKSSREAGTHADIVAQRAPLWQSYSVDDSTGAVSVDDDIDIDSTAGAGASPDAAVAAAYARALASVGAAVADDDSGNSSGVPPAIAAAGFLPAPNTSKDTILVVPKLKLLFCFIPKNACTQFNKLVNALNEKNFLGDVCGLKDPNWKSAWRFMLDSANASDTSEIDRLLRDPSWMKAAFLRDPLDRLVSAFRSECQKPRECGGCLGDDLVKGPNFFMCEFLTKHPERHGCYPEFDHVVSLFAKERNQHFSAQSSFCGGAASLQDYDYIGHLSSDYTDVNRQVQEMLEMAMRRTPSFVVPDLAFRRAAQKAGEKAAQEAAAAEDAAKASSSNSNKLEGVVSLAQMSQQTRFAPGLDAISQLAADLASTFFVPASARDVEEPYFSGYTEPHGAEDTTRLMFPTSGAPDGARWHMHHTTNASDYYANQTTLSTALSFYAADYSSLPGLVVPAWAEA